MNKRLASIFLLAAMGLSGCEKQNTQCFSVPNEASYKITAVSASEGEAAVYKRAEDCIYANAYRFSNVSPEANLAVDAVMGSCLAQIQQAQSQAYLITTASNITVPPPLGFMLDAPALPACEDGKTECLPWKREWKSGDLEKSQTAAEKVSEQRFQSLKLIAAYRVIEARKFHCEEK